MILILQILTLMACGAMVFQDLKDREVTWFIFPLIGLLLAMIHFYRSTISIFLISVLGNFVLVSCVLLILWTTTRLVFRKKFLDVSFGTGDLFFMYAMALGFPTLTFIYVFVGSVCFALAAFLTMNLFHKMETVPLAGYMGMFLIVVFLLTYWPTTPSLYTY
ncbi:hypothetical protein [Allomuricauda sp. M10]|uniref:hypothetical protein n=1 Tax=Allomuricauda sp. M10 TaxID=2683292 RepID=UPI001D18AB54|nr:hypothetical protein [Muricauda sp. M10]